MSMVEKRLNLVKYAGEFWVTLADFTETRSTEGYSGSASVKSALRTVVVKSNPDAYIAFRGEVQIKNIIQENKDNPLFYPEDFHGHTRTALIAFDMVELLDSRFKVKDEWKEVYKNFLDEAQRYIDNQSKEQSSESLITERSSMLRYLRAEKAKIEKDIETLTHNLEKINQAISAIESLEIVND